MNSLLTVMHLFCIVLFLLLPLIDCLIKNTLQTRPNLLHKEAGLEETPCPVLQGTQQRAEKGLKAAAAAVPQLQLIAVRAGPQGRSVYACCGVPSLHGESKTSFCVYSLVTKTDTAAPPETCHRVALWARRLVPNSLNREVL